MQIRGYAVQLSLQLGRNDVDSISFLAEKPQRTTFRHTVKVLVSREELSIMLDHNCCYETVNSRSRYAFAPAGICHAGSFDMGLLSNENEWKAWQELYQSVILSFSPYS